MTYHQVPHYVQEASKLPEFLLPFDPVEPIRIIKKAAKPNYGWDLYREVIDKWSERQAATVYDNTGSTPIVDPHYRRNSLFHTIPLNQEFMGGLFQLAQATAKEKWGVPGLKQLHEWTLAGYEAGEFFGQHCDTSIRLPDGSHKAVLPRLVTAVYYVNQHGESNWGFEGGSLEFPGIINDETGETFKVIPDEGDLVVFPSNWAYSHKVNPVTKGFRVTLTNFFGRNP